MATASMSPAWIWLPAGLGVVWWLHRRARFKPMSWRDQFTTLPTYRYQYRPGMERADRDTINRIGRARMMATLESQDRVTRAERLNRRLQLRRIK